MTPQNRSHFKMQRKYLTVVKNEKNFLMRPKERVAADDVVV